MRNHGILLGWVAVLALWGTVSTLAADGPAFTDPEQAGPDFLVQGEYVGTVGSARAARAIAAQVIALGNGQFEGVLYAGGLPGAGWDESMPFHFRGQTQGDSTEFVGMHGERLMFENPNFAGQIKSGVFSGRADMFRNVVDISSFELKKIDRVSPTLGAKPPGGAIVLFDGANTEEWVNGKIVESNLLDNGTESRRKFGDRDYRFHLEFRTPFVPTGQGMGRGNSGVYVNKIWEIQVLDSFGWNNQNRKFERLADFGRCGGIHELVEPRWNMCLPPLSWQTYDVEFFAARFDQDKKLVAPEIMTVRHNGVVIHDRYVIPLVPAGHDVKSSKTGQAGPLLLQNHGNPVRYRNIWVFVP